MRESKGRISLMPMTLVPCRIMVCTRPYISYAVIMVRRDTHDPGKEHWMAVKWNMRYIQDTIDIGLKYHKGKISFVIFQLGMFIPAIMEILISDSECVGYVFTMASGLICWRSTLQSTVVLSIIEAVTEAFQESYLAS